MLLGVKTGEVHIFWAEVGVPGPLEYKGLLFENIKKDSYRFVISASTAGILPLSKVMFEIFTLRSKGTTVTWRGFGCNGTIAQARAHVQSRILEFNDLTGNGSLFILFLLFFLPLLPVAYASQNYVMFPGMDIIGDDILVLPNV